MHDPVIVVLPALIVREMRSAARQPFSYYLRVLGVAALLIDLVLLLSEHGAVAQRGGEMFAHLHATLMLAIWVLVPLVTADCISRERREQTLPILFLTPLTPHQIVLAKGTANGLRSLTLWLSVLPIMAIPFLIGGVSWVEALLSISLSFGSICLAMAAGLLASTAARVAMRALVLAASLGALFFFGFVVEVGLLVSGSRAAPPFATVYEGGLWDLFENGLQLALDGGACWQELLGTVVRPWLGAPGFPGPSRGLGANLPLLISIGVASISGPLALILLIRLASWILNRAWREEPPPAEVVRIQQALCSPVYFKSAFQRWMRWELNRNPIGWLEQRTWSARLVTWSWFAVFICIYSSLLSNLSLYQRAFHGIQTILAWLLATSVAVSSARSFHRERESGLLELLLVSPLDERQIIFGRIRGLWTQFTPAMVLLLGLWIFLATIIASGEHELGSILFCGSTLLTLPIIGLYESLARRHFVSALLSTLLLGVVLPTVLAQLGRFLDFVLWMTGQPHALSQTESDGFLVAIPLQCGVAIACVWKLHRNLRARRFALQPT